MPNRILSGIYLIVLSYDGGWYGHSGCFHHSTGQELRFCWSPQLVSTLTSMAFLLLLFLVLPYSTKANISRLSCASNYGKRKGSKSNFEISTLLKHSCNIRARMYAIIFYQTFTLLNRKTHKTWAPDSQFNKSNEIFCPPGRIPLTSRSDIHFN